MWLFFFFAHERQDENAAKFCFSSNLWEDMVAEEGVSVSPEMGRAPPSGASGLVHDSPASPVPWGLGSSFLWLKRRVPKHSTFKNILIFLSHSKLLYLIFFFNRFFFFFNFSVLESNLFHWHQWETSLVSSTLKIVKSVTVRVLKRESVY